ncbi:type I restriction-modification system endonuclease [Desulfosporosinus nitroreducens]|uniref:Type I restriction-modification system endonuclease n=1 Tax=Desulfosporosinus nitroreducens TaxID=2018668 RepID=A0ABT8QK87_9FIRM|nr:type I restriction-modification system endonuclease [Desulfosporosinus nitroreducens]MDO0821297.1 type I restriction-modification system endonuclease [Desulfosporosinus nitroreducens]
MKSNFFFLEERWPILASLGSMSEKYLYTDSNSCLIKLGVFAESIVRLMFALDKIPEPQEENTQANRIRILKREGLLPKDIDDILYAIRISRNDAVHDGYESTEQAKILLEFAFKLGIWFMQTYGIWNYEPKFVMPEDTIREADFESIIEAQEEKIKQLTEKIKTAPGNETDISIADRRKRANTSADKINLSEKETRYLIDEQLRKVGWEADTIHLRYSKGARPQKGKNLAIAEWPTDSTVGNGGFADYALFAGIRLIGVIEAKRHIADIPSVIDYQCKDYAQHIKAEHSAYIVDKWGDYLVPFLFATNGRRYLKQIETKSGIWFLDARKSTNIPKALQGWVSPDGLMELLTSDIDKADKKLKETAYDLLSDKDGLNLRPYQIEAIKVAEQSVIDGQQSILLSMATGTGKTRTILGLIYRLIKASRFKRVLFLVDRTALGEQAQDVFKEVKLEDLMTLDEIYNIKELEDKDFDKETKIHVATVQSLVKRIMYNEDETMPAVTDYDLVVIDEAHRGYILDKEMGDDEFLYRNQDDYVSKYRTVIEYFDSVKIALTATPALHTTEIFGKPVFNYSYREAVIEGYLVDHDAPHNLGTKLSTEGIHYDKGESVAIYDPVTGEITNSDELEDELNFDVESFNRKVITEPFNRTVLEEIAKSINPDGEGKTLIYAVDNTHADLIVKLLKEIYEEYGVDNDAITKITGSVGGGNRKKISEAIKKFKNEKYPNIAVTVDLLTTGVDVPEIVTLVFMRRVKSRILFEQMLGRATRLCPEISKTHFEIFDPVGVYESLEPVNTMKPVVANPTATFENLIKGLETLPTEEQKKNQIDMIIAKLQRTKRKLNGKSMEHFIDLSGGKNPTQFIEELESMPLEKAKEHILRNKRLFEMLNEGGYNPTKPVIISFKEDRLVYHTRGYGKAEKPEDYLVEFKNFIQNNIDKIAALNIVCTRPKELTREALKSLKLELDRNEFTEVQLNSAWRELKNEDITADIITFIRQQAIGSPLISHEERIKNAVSKLKKKHNFSKMELDWLVRIEANLLYESILDKETFDTGAFKSKGGYKVINKIFRNRLDEIVSELNDYLYEDWSA